MSSTAHLRLVSCGVVENLSLCGCAEYHTADQKEFGIPRQRQSLPSSSLHSIEAPQQCIPKPPGRPQSKWLCVRLNYTLLTYIHQQYSPLISLSRAAPAPATQPTSTSKSCTATLFKLWLQGFFAFVPPAAHWSSQSVLQFVFRSSSAHSTRTARTALSSRPVRRQVRTLAVPRQFH